MLPELSQGVGRMAEAALGSMEAAEEPAAFAVDERGMICDCNGAAEKLFGYRRSEIVWRHVSLLLPQLADIELMQDGQPNPRLRFLCHSGRCFEAVGKDGQRFTSELFLVHLHNPGKRSLRMIVRRT